MTCASLIAAQSDQAKPAAQPVSRIGKYLGQRVVSILSAPTKVEAFRVDPEARHDWAKGTAKVLGPDSPAALSAVLLNENTYRWEGDNPVGMRCVFQPGVAYRFWKDQEAVSVLVCFKCSEVAFETDNAEDKDRRIGRAIWAQLRPEIVQLTKQIFPDDKAIQAIKD
jgi:hypothetical protein